MNLPNGTTVLTNIVETIFLSKNLTLTDVYYIPIFNVKSISASKLIDSYFDHFTFTNDNFFILQTYSKILIGLTDRHGDLYVLTSQAFFPKTSPPLLVTLCLLFILLLGIGD